MLHEICNIFDLHQLVQHPTRGDYLLDLCLTDLATSPIRILPAIADHKILYVSLNIPMPESISFSRKVWCFKDTDWKKMKQVLKSMNWNRLSVGSVDAATNYFLDFVWTLCEKYIPRREILERKSTHPWLTSECSSAILQKNIAEGTSLVQQSRNECAATIQKAHRSYIAKLKIRISNLSRNNKE